MTSSNVSNMLVQMNSSNGQVDLQTKGKGESVGNLFESTLQNLSSFSVGDASANTTNVFDNTFDSGVKVSVVKTEAKDYSKDISKQDQTKYEDVTEKVEKFASAVKDVIKDEMEVSDEDIEKAMEVLGLTAVDLLNPQNIAQLVLELSGEVESVSLILSEDFKNIIDQVSELVDQLLDDTGISLSDVKEVVIALESEEIQKIDVQESAVPGGEVQNDDMADSKETVDVLNESVQLSEEVGKYSNVETKADSNEVEVQTESVVVSEAESKTENESQMNSNGGNAKNNVFAKEDSHVIGNENVMVQTDSKFELHFNAESEVVLLSSGEEVNVQEIVDQIVEQARILNTESQTTMEMTLNPEGLGKVFMEITQKGDEITAKLFAENEVVKEALESQMANLRADLNQTSQKVTSIEVAVGAHEFERNLEEDARREQQRQEQAEEQKSKHRAINLSSLDELTGLMSEEEQLVAQIMRENGNTLDYQA